MKLFAWTLCFALVGLVAAWSKEGAALSLLSVEQ